MSDEAPEVPESAPAVAAPPLPSRRTTWLRLGALALLTVALLVIGHVTGLSEHLTRDRVQQIMLDAGAWGFFAFLAIFAIGELVHVPGMVFFAAAILAYGQVLGFAAGLAGAIVSLTVSFYVVRGIGGQPLGQVQRPIVKKMLARLETRPISTIAVLRVLFQMLPALNYALAMSKVRYRDFMLGSIAGLVPVLLVASLAFDWLFG